jgi:hypothetical protein
VYEELVSPDAHYRDPDWKASGWRPLEDRLAATTSPRQRLLLENVIEHHKAEAVGDVDRIMKTLVPEPAYHYWGLGGNGEGPKGAAAVRNYYTNEYYKGGFLIIHASKDRIVVDDNTIVHEGKVHMMTTGDIAKRNGYNVVDDSQAAHYLLRMRSVLFWGFSEEGLAYGEDAYGSMHPDDFDAVDRANLPQVYVEYMEMLGRKV